MPRASENTHIPLVCNLCPKNPQFSDVSHLLTHVSSKSHLQQKFNLEVHGQTDQQVSHQLQAYNNWFHNYGIARLLGERMSSKENKKNGIKRPKTANNKSKKEARVIIKSENIHPDLYNQPGSMFRAPTPFMQTNLPAPMNSWAGGYSTNHNTPGPASEWGDDSPYGTPTMRNNVPNFGPFQPNEQTAAVAEDVASKNFYDSDGEEDEEDAHRVSRASQLKGQKWPGMGLFDSATPEMQRRRNQKKDGSILEGMKRTSLTTEPTEVVYNRDGGFKRSRPIYSHSDSEEETLELMEATTPPAKRRGRKPGHALQKVDGNAPRLRKSSAINNARQSGTRTHSDMVNFNDGSKLGNASNNSYSFGPMSRSASSGTTSSTGVSRYEPSISEDNDFLSYRETKPSKKSKSRALRDERVSVEDEEEISPGRTESTLEDHRFDDFQPDLYQAVPARLTSPSPSYRQNIGDRQPSRAITRNRELPERESMGSDQHHFVAERESARYTTQYGYGSTMQFAPNQYFHEAATINPLRAQLQPPHPLQYRDYPYAYSDSNGFAGDFRPLSVGPTQYTPLPSHLSGGPSSGNSGAALATSTQHGSTDAVYYA